MIKKVGQPVDDWFMNRWPVYKVVKFAIRLQHIHRFLIEGVAIS